MADGGAKVGTVREEASQERRCPTCGASYPGDYAVCPRDATPLARSGAGADTLVGQVLADTYEVVRLIGEGGMGRVYEVRHVRLGGAMALKLLHRHLCEDEEVMARFRREAVATAGIQSPHVARVVDVNATRDGQPYIVHELVQGEDLGRVLEREGPLPIARAVAIARQVCQALVAAHAAGVIHRDLKPDNVMLVTGHDGLESVKVLDFGIAKTLDDRGLTRTGVVLGTPAYMAPEQARGSAAIDHRVDVYSLGAMLYRATTGRPPYAGDTATHTLTRVLEEDPERPRRLRRDLPEALEFVIQKAMSRDPADRHATMAELDAALAPFDEGPARATVPQMPARGEATAGDMARAATIAIDRSVRGGGERAGHARLRVVAWTAVLLLWFVVGVASLVAGAIEAGAARPVAGVERLLCAAVALLATLPLAVLWARHLGRRGWGNTAAMVARADDLAWVGATSLAAFAVVRGVGDALQVAGVVAAVQPARIVAWLASLLAAAATTALRARKP